MLSFLFVLQVTWFGPRLGKREKFSNVRKAQCHAVSTAAQRKASASLHENVKGFDPQMLVQHLLQKIMMSESLNFIFIVAMSYPTASHQLPHIIMILLCPACR